MRLIPEYAPARKLDLVFVHDFFNTRFQYGKVQCDIIRAASQFVEVELLIEEAELPHWQAEAEKFSLPPDRYTLLLDSPRRAIVLETVPIFAEDDDGRPVGLVFRNPNIEEAGRLKRFARRMVRRLGMRCVDMGFDFASAHIAVNEDVVLLSDYWFKGKAGAAKLDYFKNHFPGQHFHLVPPLAGDITNDLDMCLWPVRPRVWITSEYPAGSVQAESMEPALRLLREHGHTVHRVPALEPIIHDDINTMPNYVNGVILNEAALVPAYDRPEDAVVQGILRECGFTVLPIDCRQVILTNSAIHCISKVIPAGKGQEAPRQPG